MHGLFPLQMEALLQVQSEFRDVRLGYETKLEEQEREVATLRDSLQEREAKEREARERDRGRETCTHTHLVSPQ